MRYIELLIKFVQLYIINDVTRKFFYLDISMLDTAIDTAIATGFLISTAVVMFLTFFIIIRFM